MKEKWWFSVQFPKYKHDNDLYSHELLFSNLAGNGIFKYDEVGNEISHCDHRNLLRNDDLLIAENLDIMKEDLIKISNYFINNISTYFAYDYYDAYKKTDFLSGNKYFDSAIRNMKLNKLLNEG